MTEKLVFYLIMYLVADMATDAKREMRPKTLVLNLPSCLFTEFFCFTLVLKYGGLHIMGLGQKTVKACCDILHLVNTELLYLG